MVKNYKVKTQNRKSAMVDLKYYCVFAMSSDRKNKGDFLEVTEWANGEGYDIHICDTDGEKIFRLTYGQYEALEHCMEAIISSYDDKIVGEE
jgi:hypothetical protein